VVWGFAVAAERHRNPEALTVGEVSRREFSRVQRTMKTTTIRRRRSRGTRGGQRRRVLGGGA